MGRSNQKPDLLQTADGGKPCLPASTTAALRPAQELADASTSKQQQLAAAEQRHVEAAAGLRRQLEAREAAHTDELGQLRWRLEASEQKLADAQVQCKDDVCSMTKEKPPIVTAIKSGACWVAHSLL
jgi:hypothetical protein